MAEFDLDHDRSRRLGFPEVIYGGAKPVGLLVDILTEYQSKGQNALITKLQADKGETLLKQFPSAFFDVISGCFLLQLNIDKPEAKKVAILSAGSSDQYVVNEAYYTFNLLKEPAARFTDIGVAGIHRLMARLDEIKEYKVIIVVAGFEGALPSVVGGLLNLPIIAVPTSTGYGVAAGGHTALHGMLSSCANGITVTNIDNGYGAAMAAYRILQLLKSA
jgi:pyridinium-3,5-biscarboxylic acid mononucleotide synthase